jgi:type IV pilus biogenesis protein PilP
MFNHKRQLVAIAVAASFLFSNAFAEETAAQQLQELAQSRAIWAAKKADEDMRGQYLAKKAEADKFSPVQNSASSFGDKESPPVIWGIEGIDGKLSAVLLFTGGTKQTVKQGEKIRGGWNVNQISANSVVLARGQERLVLGFGDEPPRQPAATNGGTVAGGFPSGFPSGFQTRPPEQLTPTSQSQPAR